MTDTRWLAKRGGRTWHAVQAVPRDLQKAMGRRAMVKSLCTRDLHVAIARRHSALAEFAKAFERARAPAAASDVTTAAMAWRQTITAIERGDPSAGVGPGADGTDLTGVALMTLADEAENIEREHGAAAAREFVGIAHGTATPLPLHIEAWLAEGGVKGPLRPRTASQYRSDVLALADWAKGVGVTTIEGFTKQIAGRYVTEQLVQRGVQWATGNRKITAASAYWRWLRKRTGIEANPWAGQSLSKGAGRTGDRSKRPFTDAEVRALLAGDADPELADAMRVAALSGARLEELYRLTVADCTGGWFNLRASKTRAGVRRVPIHSALAGLVERRCAGKAPGGFVFNEAGAAKAGRERSAALSKRFGRYRQELGVHDRDNGMRHSRCDFHSFRRWFVTTARNAGIDRATVAAVVGHETGSITDDVYSGGPSEALLRACVEAVKLPG